MNEHQKQIDLQGHRGARGLKPENTIPAFLEALKYGVTTLELDLAVTKDGELLVSHEPWMNPVICTDATGDQLREDTLLNIYQMTYEEIAQYDCGSSGNPRFPEQEKMKVSKPLLIDVVNAVSQELPRYKLESIRWNIEIKSLPEGDTIYHPVPGEFSDKVYQFINDNMDKELVTVQSFDLRVLQYFNQQYPDITVALLIENEKTHHQNIEELGFKPNIYSCYYKLLSKGTIDDLHNKDIKVIPWTVNDSTSMRELIDWGVDGIITDYPNIAQDLLKDYNE